MTNKEIENNFTYHAPSADMPPKFEKLRNKAKELAYLINELVPNGREQSLAQTKLQEVIMWANAGIAIPKKEDKKEELPEYVEHKIHSQTPESETEEFIKEMRDKGYRLIEVMEKDYGRYYVYKFKRCKC